MATTPQTLQDRAWVIGAGRTAACALAGVKAQTRGPPRSVDPDCPVFPSLPQRELPP